MTGSRARHLSAVAGTAALALLAGPASAEISIAAARIAEGHLWVMGQSDEPSARISLDDTFEVWTDRSGRFEFRVIHHPATCIVRLKTAAQSQRAVVAGCGQAGPKGEAGAAGPPGRPGPPGPSGGVVASADPPPVAAPPPTVPTRSAAVQPPAGPSASALLAARPPETTQSLPATPPVAPAEPRPRPAPAVAAVPPAPPAPPPSPIGGEWFDENGKARIKVAPCGDALCGHVVWSKEGGGVGTKILSGFKQSGPNKWEGTITNPENGKSYSSSLTPQGGTMKVQGCMMGILCGGETWTRAQ